MRRGGDTPALRAAFPTAAGLPLVVGSRPPLFQTNRAGTSPAPTISGYSTRTDAFAVPIFPVAASRTLTTIW
jgi:hypothetical protein